jgi:hypothetical protein
MSEEQRENGGDVPEIELIIKVSKALFCLHKFKSKVCVVGELELLEAKNKLVSTQ